MDYVKWHVTQYIKYILLSVQRMSSAWQHACDQINDEYSIRIVGRQVKGWMERADRQPLVLGLLTLLLVTHGDSIQCVLTDYNGRMNSQFLLLVCHERQVV